MGFFSKLKNFFGGKKEDDFDGMEEGGDFDISSDEGVDELLTNDDSNSNDDFMDEMSSDFDSTNESMHEEEPASFESEESGYQEETQVDNSFGDEQYNSGTEDSYYDVANQSYDNSKFDNTSYQPESNYSFEADQNLTQPNEEIFMEIQNRIKMIREKTEELKRLREQNQASEQQAKE